MRKPSKYLLENLSKNLINYRKIRGLSQEQLAEECGLHRTYIGSLERCERNVTLSILELLSKALDVSIAQLLEHNGEQYETSNDSFTKS